MSWPAQSRQVQTWVAQQHECPTYDSAPKCTLPCCAHSGPAPRPRGHGTQQERHANASIGHTRAEQRADAAARVQQSARPITCHPTPACLSRAGTRHGCWLLPLGACPAGRPRRTVPVSLLAPNHVPARFSCCCRAWHSLSACTSAKHQNTGAGMRHAACRQGKGAGGGRRCESWAGGAHWQRRGIAACVPAVGQHCITLCGPCPNHPSDTWSSRGRSLQGTPASQQVAGSAWAGLGAVEHAAVTSASGAAARAAQRPSAADNTGSFCTDRLASSAVYGLTQPVCSSSGSTSSSSGWVRRWCRLAGFGSGGGRAIPCSAGRADLSRQQQNQGYA